MRVNRLYRDIGGISLDLAGYPRPTFVPDSMASDGITAPRWVRRLFGLGRYDMCGRVHDWMYRFQPFSRQTADDIFCQCLLLHGCNKKTARLAHWTVRVCGWWYWTK